MVAVVLRSRADTDTEVGLSTNLHRKEPYPIRAFSLLKAPTIVLSQLRIYDTMCYADDERTLNIYSKYIYIGLGCWPSQSSKPLGMLAYILKATHWLWSLRWRQVGVPILHLPTRFNCLFSVTSRYLQQGEGLHWALLKFAKVRWQLYNKDAEAEPDLELLVEDGHFADNSYKFNLTLPRKVSNFCLNFRQILEQENYFALNIWKVCTATSVYSWVHLPTHAYCYKEINFLKLSIKILHFRNFVQINYSTLGIAGKWWQPFNFQSYGL